MEAKAKLRHLRISPKKVRLIADAIRGLKVGEAEVQLKFMNKRASEPVLKLLMSALANAQNNFDLEKDNLYIKEIFVNEGATLKRWMPRAFGRATPIRKRTSHVDLTLGELVETEKKETKKDKKVKKEDIQEVSSLDEIKDKAEGIKADDSKEMSKGGKNAKGFTKKVFNRKSV